MSDFVYLALTLLSFAGLALLVGILGSRLDPDPDPEPDPDSTDRAAGREDDHLPAGVRQ